MFSRDEMQRAIEDALKSMEGVALELYRRGREPLLEELEEARARNADMRAMLEQVTRERDEARASCPDCAMWAERSARWHDDMQRAERERDEARASAADQFRRGAEAMREACAEKVGSYTAWSESPSVEFLEEQVRALPIPEEP